MTSRAEHRFLLFAQEALRGRPARAGRDALASTKDGLTRDGKGGIPVRAALEDFVSKAVLRWLAMGGGLVPRRYVVQGRRREGTLFDPAIFGGVEPLRFTMASFFMLEALHDRDPMRLHEALVPPATLGDRLVYALALAEASPEARIGATGVAVLPALRRLEVRDPAGLEGLVSGADAALVLRALEPDLVLGWVERARALFTVSPDARSEWLDLAGVSVAAYASVVAAQERHELLSALGDFYRRLLRDVAAPEQWLAWASEVAGEYRKVSDREAWLRRLGGLFAAAPCLEDQAARIQGLPFVEREESEKLFFDEYQARCKDAVERAAALHTALVGRIA